MFTQDNNINSISNISLLVTARSDFTNNINYERCR